LAVCAAAQFVHDFALPLFATIAPDSPGVHGSHPQSVGPASHPLEKVIADMASTRRSRGGQSH
jgi:hypothetical protein